MSQLSLFNDDAGKMLAKKINDEGPWRPPTGAEEKAEAWAQQLVSEEGWAYEVALARARSCYGLRARRPTPPEGPDREFCRRVVDHIANSRHEE